jgi:hypothetical protein
VPRLQKLDAPSSSIAPPTWFRSLS